MNEFLPEPPRFSNPMCCGGGEVNVLHFCETFTSRKTKPLFISQGHTQEPRQRGGGGGLGGGRQVCVSDGDSFVKFGLGIKKAVSFYN